MLTRTVTRLQLAEQRASAIQCEVVFGALGVRAASRGGSNRGAPAPACGATGTPACSTLQDGGRV